MNWRREKGVTTGAGASIAGHCQHLRACLGPGLQARVVMEEEGELVARDGCNGVGVDIAGDIGATDPDDGKLLRNTDPGDRGVEDDVEEDVPAIRHFEPVFARAKRFEGEDLQRSQILRKFCDMNICFLKDLPGH